ncbi:MAG: hypothetical protein HC853_01430 [Anaerolineae bacterium]|nr:hypothetical protein [Anaerolineae bacterium]
MIHIIRRRATKRQMKEMLEVFGTFIKLAVDVRLEVLAGGGELHADCEQALLNDESEQVDIWGADWDPVNQVVTFESLINIRPRQNNRKMEVQDPELRAKIERVVVDLLGGVEYE